MGPSRPDVSPRSAAAPRRPTILIADGDASLRNTLDAVLRSRGYRILQAADGATTLDLVRRYRIDVVFLDVRCGQSGDGFEVLGQIRARFPEVEVIMCSADREVQPAVRAIKLGAVDFLTKDFGALSRAGDMVETALAKQGTIRDQSGDRSESSRALDGGLVVGRSPKMRQLVEVVAKVAPAPATVLIQGESGTGKELLARLVHRWSPRSDQAFVAINVTTVPPDLAESILFGYEKGAFTDAVKATPGKFELAHGGTLFLDEIADLPYVVQGKLLRAIQEREVERIGGTETISVDVRLVAATNKDLLSEVRAGRFREDLYYRLNVIPLRVPPLRERREEIPELATFFARKYAARVRREAPTLSEKAMARCIAYQWPGNVRELEHMFERLVTVCERPVFDESDLPAELAGPPAEMPSAPRVGGAPEDLQVACETFERNYLTEALERHGWNRAECARQLGISYATMKNKLAKYAIVEPAQARRELARSASRPPVRRSQMVEIAEAADVARSRK